MFDTEKLEWMNGQYLSALPAEELLPPVRRQLARWGCHEGRDLGPIIDAVKARSRTILQVAEQVAVRLEPSRSTLDAKGEALMRKMGAGLRRQPPAGGRALEPGPEELDGRAIVETLKALAEAPGLKLGT